MGWKEEGKGKEGEARKGEAEGEGRVSGGVGRRREDEGGMQGNNFCPLSQTQFLSRPLGFSVFYIHLLDSRFHNFRFGRMVRSHALQINLRI